MALGDIRLLNEQAMGDAGSRVWQVASGAAASINAGEPVAVTPGTCSGYAMATNKPVSGTDYLAGIAATTSTDTVTAAGTVQVHKLDPNQVWLMKPNASTSWDTQAEYDALVGDRVLIDLTASSYTILATDGATYGCIIQPLDIVKHPGKVAFSFSSAVIYNG